jgi:hypothetical protein
MGTNYGLGIVCQKGDCLCHGDINGRIINRMGSPQAALRRQNLFMVRDFSIDY